MTSQTVLPTFSIAAPDAIVGLKFQNAGATSLDGGITTLGQVFAAGDLPPGAALVAWINGKAVAVQVDVKTTYDDGSAKMTVLSVERSDLAAGASVDVVLARTPVATAVAPALDLTKALAGHAFTVDATIHGGASIAVDVLGALKTAIANGTASFWQQGAIATGARVEIDLPGSQRMVFDVTAYKDGGFSVEAQFNNDQAMQAVGGAVAYDVRVRMDGATVLSTTVNQAQYQNWHETFASGSDGGQGLGAATSGWLNIQHDTTYLEKTGAIADYNRATGVSETLLQSLASATQAAGWGDPLAANGVAQFMPATGGRPDIGITTQSTTAWLMTQDARAAAYAMGQAEAAGAVPIHFYDSVNKTWVNTDNFPHLWLDGRGGIGIPGDAASGTLTQAIGGTGWAFDTAHQPDLSYVPYLMTGARWILDNVTAQAAASILQEWPYYRQDGNDFVANGSQVRSAAWSLRQIDEAASMASDGSIEKAYFTAASDANWKFLVSKIPEWTAQQGEAHGWLPGDYGVPGAIPPWQQDYFASTVIAAARQGNADALTFLEWQTNFLVGRFTHGAQGFSSHDGVAYLIATSDASTGALYKTWASIGDHTTSNGWSNGTGWSHVDGNYAQVALATLSGIYQLTGNADALRAYQMLVSDGAPFIDAATMASDPTYNLAVPAGVTMPTGASAPPVSTPVTPPPVVTTPELDYPIVLTIGTGADKLVFLMSETAWNGHAQYTIDVDGVRVGGVMTAAADHRQGHADIITLQTDLGAGPHKLTVHFLNDAWGGSEATDRNLYIEGITINGTIVPGSTYSLNAEGQVDFLVPAPVAPQPFTGDAANNTISGNNLANLISGLGGNDSLSGRDGVDTLYGGEGDDTLSGGTGADIAFGGNGNDLYFVDDASDKVIEAQGGGIDKVIATVSFRLGDNVESLELRGSAILSGWGNGEHNLILGNNAGDQLYGLGGNDTIQGGNGKDAIFGGDGNDQIFGGAGDDSLDGGAGTDLLVGGLGRDTMQGGTGIDTFRYGSATEGGDRIIGFASGVDFLEISASGFGGGLARTALGHFTSNTTGRTDAPSGVGQFIYETDTSRLWWDADGAGGKGSVLIANFDASTSLTVADLHVIG